MDETLQLRSERGIRTSVRKGALDQAGAFGEDGGHDAAPVVGGRDADRSAVTGVASGRDQPARGTGSPPEP